MNIRIKEKKENAINNSYFIKELFNQKVNIYRPPLSKKMQRVEDKGRNGKVKIFSRKTLTHF